MDQSSSQFTVSRRESRQRKTDKKDDNQRQGRWSSQQNIKYLVFLSFNLLKFECKKKRMFRLYKPLSKFLITRTSEQCRSHHRKLLQRFKTPKNILLSLEQQFDKEEIQNFRQRHIQVLKQLPIPQKKLGSNEKEEQFSSKVEQKNIFENQNQGDQGENAQQKKSWPLEEKNKDLLTPISSLYLQCSEEMSFLNYQALNWLNQIYTANLSYCLEVNYQNYRNLFLSQPGNNQNS